LVYLYYYSMKILTKKIVNDSLIKPALVASLFLGSETSPATVATNMSPTSPLWDAFSGYLFARMARREGITPRPPFVSTELHILTPQS
jgi:hypothetical protein